MQRAVADGCAAAVGIARGQSQRAGTGLNQTSRAADHVGKCVAARQIQNERAGILDDVGAERAGSCAVAQLQNPLVDDGDAGIIICGQNRQRAGIGLGQRAGAGNFSNAADDVIGSCIHQHRRRLKRGRQVHRRIDRAGVVKRHKISVAENVRRRAVQPIGRCIIPGIGGTIAGPGALRAANG